MGFKKNLSGIEFYLEIRDYVMPDKDYPEIDWCKVDFEISFKDIINYKLENQELILSDEIPRLIKKMENILSGETKEIVEHEFCEPDFIIKLYPKFDVRNDENLLYVKKGCEMQPAYMEWKVGLWEVGFTSNYISIHFDELEMGELLEYLKLIAAGDLS